MPHMRYAIQKREFDYIKIKIVQKKKKKKKKKKNGASVSEEFALFNWSSVGYMRSTIWSNKYFQYLINHHAILKWNWNLNNVSLIFPRERLHEIFHNKKETNLQQEEHK